MTTPRRPVNGRPAGMVFILAFAAGLAAQSPAAVDVAFDKFFATASPADAMVAADDLVAAGVDFDTAYARLKKGRVSGNEKRGAGESPCQKAGTVVPADSRHRFGMSDRQICSIVDSVDPVSESRLGRLVT